MFEDSDPRHELWDTEEEEEEEEESDSSSDGSQESSGDGDEGQGFGAGGQDPASCLPLQWASLGSQSCRRWLFAPYPFQDRSSTGPTSCNGTGIRPCGRETPPRDQPPSCWVHDIKAICTRNWPTQQATLGCSRTLSHPSFQSFYSAVSTCDRSSLPSLGGCAPPLGSEPKAEPLPLVDGSSFFYIDPMMPPGHRIYNWLSNPSQQVFRRLSLDTPAPIMSIREASPPRKACARSQWFSDLECEAVCALLELPDGTSHDPGGCQPSPPLPCEVKGEGGGERDALPELCL
ncbi:histone deacetylase complex subunit SAP25 isoform X2 [Rhineura floridana]|nr:histone deacetylase complex subunit SAP25 isoform X2 [Rhineura floridana]XP_061445428.1 histone deacetylase complex subunit SAP25 isoform X2 [Rhineura floridana]